ncbi:hypothetical protein D1007_18240 [Hordeum vulgare]|nr:hypothetical protein D1007_18240 [Hordeum vulgare]
MIDDGHIAYLRQTSKLPSEEVVEAHMPGDELVPEPRDGELLIFASHFLVGFELPASSFLRHFLQSFGLQIHHVGVNVVLYITCFITMCEAYLGNRPFSTFFPHFFYLCSQKHGAVDYSCDGAVIYRRNGVIELPEAEASVLETEQLASLAAEHAATSRLEKEGCVKAKAVPTAPTGADGPSTEAMRAPMTTTPPEGPNARSSPAPADAHPEPPLEVMALPASVLTAQEVDRPASDPERRTAAEADAPGDGG